jgi:hypothetical protein
MVLSLKLESLATIENLQIVSRQVPWFKEPPEREPP